MQSVGYIGEDAARSPRIYNPFVPSLQNESAKRPSHSLQKKNL